MGRLSNPPKAVDTLADRGWSGPARHPGAVVRGALGPDSGHLAGMPEQKGLLSNPLQRRLSSTDIGELCDLYGEGFIRSCNDRVELRRCRLRLGDCEHGRPESPECLIPKTKWLDTIDIS